MKTSKEIRKEKQVLKEQLETIKNDERTALRREIKEVFFDIFEKFPEVETFSFCVSYPCYDDLADMRNYLSVNLEYSPFLINGEPVELLEEGQLDLREPFHQYIYDKLMELFTPYERDYDYILNFIRGQDATIVYRDGFMRTDFNYHRTHVCSWMDPESDFSYNFEEKTRKKND